MAKMFQHQDSKYFDKLCKSEGHTTHNTHSKDENKKVKKYEKYAQASGSKKRKEKV